MSTPVTERTGTTDTTAASASATGSKGSSLGQDAFLKLLVTQLTHQDPDASRWTTPSSSRSWRPSASWSS